MPSLRSRAIYSFLKRFDSPFASETSLARQRANIERQAKFAGMPAGVEVRPLKIGELNGEWIQPHKAPKDRAILYLHGGGYTMGSCSTHRAMAARIALASQAPTLIVDYRLAPEHPYPAALEDANQCYHWLLDQGLTANRIVLTGDSAGGGLALALALFLRDSQTPLPAGIVCLSPWADLSLAGESMSTCADSDPLISRESSAVHASWYVGKHDPKIPYISPVFADFDGLPPILIQVGEHEVLRSDAERVAENARQASVEVSIEVWEGMWHVWQAYGGYIPEAGQAIERAGKFIQAQVDIDALARTAGP